MVVLARDPSPGLSPGSGLDGSRISADGRRSASVAGSDTQAEGAACRSEAAIARGPRQAGTDGSGTCTTGSFNPVFAMGLSLERCQTLVTKNPPEAVNLLGTARAGLKAIIRDLRAYIMGLEPETTQGHIFPLS